VNEVLDVSTLQVWVDAELDKDGRVQFVADSDSEVTRGLAAVLVAALSGLTPAQVIEVTKSASVFSSHHISLLLLHCLSNTHLAVCEL